MAGLKANRLSRKRSHSLKRNNFEIGECKFNLNLSIFRNMKANLKVLQWSFRNIRMRYSLFEFTDLVDTIQSRIVE